MQTTLKYLLVLIIIVLTLTSFTNVNTTIPTDKFIVVLDAGHGGKDPGNLGSGFREKDIALAIILKVGELLSKDKNIKVIYTRKKDVFVDLHERGAIANKADADLFVSVHCNSHHTQANGTETFVLGTKREETNFSVAKKENEVIFLEEDYEKNYEGYDPNNPESLIGLSLLMEDYLDQSILLASYVQDNFKNNLKLKSRGVKQEGFIVLHQTYMPSVLVETGFLTYKKEGKYLNSKKGQSDMASAIVDAILKYKSEVVADPIEVEEDPLDVPIETTDIYPEITFKVQIAAGSKLLETEPYNFKGLGEISMEKNENIYRYFYGSTSDYNKIKEKKREAIKKGYSTSFVIALKNGERVPLDKVLKTTSN